jgi:hypothetical protein
LIVATPTQLRYAQAYKEHGTLRAAADALGVHPSTVGYALQAMNAKETEAGKRILVLPDVQAKPGVDFSFLRRIGQYMLEKKPDVVVCIGDFADLPSLSSYDKGTKAFEGRRYKRDVEAAQFAMQAFLGPMTEYNKTAKRPYKPRMVMTLGNHEQRIIRACNDDSKLDGILRVEDLAFAEYGWEVHPFLEVVVIEGVAFSHYFTTGVMGRPAGTAQAQLRKCAMSCFAGHQQGKQITYGTRADGKIITSIISGSCYEGHEGYLGPQGNQHWRGFWMLNDVKDGSFDEMPVSLSFVNQRYSTITYQTPAYSQPTEAELQAGRM